jgi:Uma2 family endonuclease
MSEAAKTGYMSREDYYHWTATQPQRRFERIDGHVVAMAPKGVVHAEVKATIWAAFRDALAAANLPCRALPDGVTVASGDSDYEPDAIINCGPIDDNDIAAPNPVVVVEVLSPSTQATDTGEKLDGYFAVPSIDHYLIVHPVRRRVIHHRRIRDGIHTEILSDGLINLDPPGLSVEVADFFPRRAGK